MSYSAGSNYADVIETENIDKFCHKEYYLYNEALEAHDIDKEEFAQNVEHDDLENYPKIVVDAYNNLCKAFKKKTGLTLSLGYHSTDDGDRYDEVCGIYWSVGGMYELTPAGKKMNKMVERKMWVTYG